MEFELIERPRDEDQGGDSRIIRDLRALTSRSLVRPADYPGGKDQALLIPEEEHC